MNRKTTLSSVLVVMFSVCLMTVGSKKSAAQHEIYPEWLQTIKGKMAQIAYAVCADAGGNAYTTGYIRDTVDVTSSSGTPGQLFTVGGFDIFVTKHDPKGELLWLKNFGGPSGNVESGRAIHADDFGNVYVVGGFQDSMTMPDGTTVYSNAGQNFFILKLSAATGDVSWIRTIGGPSASSLSDEARGVVVDANGDVIVRGFFTGQVDFNPAGTPVVQTSVPTANDINHFVLKMDSTGILKWVRTYENTRNNAPEDALVCDPDGNVYIGWYFTRTVDFNPGGSGGQLTARGTTPSSSPEDGAILKLSADGDFIWVRQFGGAKGDQARGLAYAPSGHLYVSGYINDTCYFPGMDSIIIPYNQNAAFFAKLDTAGVFKWVRVFSNKQASTAYGVAVDRAEQVFVAGTFRDTMDFNPPWDTVKRYGHPTYGNANELFLVKYDSAGSYLAVHTLGNSVASTNNSSTSGQLNSATPWGIGMSPEGDVFLCGYYVGGMTFGYTRDSVLIADTSLPDNYDAYMLRIGGLCSAPRTAPSISVDSFELSSLHAHYSYRWLLNGDTISGATSNMYTVTENGDYRLAVENEYGCRDTSDVYTVNNISVRDLSGKNFSVIFYPNPANDVLYIKADREIRVKITGPDGRVYLEREGNAPVPVADLADGVYILQAADIRGRFLLTDRFLKISR
jgi:hypothetical protein